MRHRSLTSLLIVTLWTPGLGLAQPVLTEEEGARQLAGLDGRIRSMRAELEDVQQGYRVPLGGEVSRLERRLREAEIQSLLGDHYRASILLFDVVEGDNFKDRPGYLEAKFLLAESLRRAGQPIAARRYYQEMADAARGRRLAQITLGLLDVASTTGDFSGTEELVRRVKAEGAGEFAPQIDFSFGKALFKGAADDVPRLTQALQLFNAVPSNVSVSAPAAYYAGVTRVRMGDLDGAIPEFQKTETLADSHPDTERVRELARLSLGRIYQEMGKTSKALDSYQDVSQDSIYFPDMLYEVAWVYVRAAADQTNETITNKFLQRALDATELLLAVAPNSHLFPRAKLLQGNLQIRLGAPESAYDTFQSLITRYDGSLTEMRTVLDSTSSAREFFDELIAADVNNITGGGLLPPVVAQIALEDRSIRRAVVMREALAETKAQLQEAADLVRTLDAALQSERRFTMFPGLQKVRVKALLVQNQLLASEKLLLNVERGMMSPYLDESTRTKARQIRSTLKSVEDDIASLPLDDQEVQGRQERMRADYEKVSLNAFTLLERIRTMQAQLKAIKHWNKTQGVVLRGKKKELNEQRMASAQLEVDRVQEALLAIRDEIDRAALLSKGDAGWARAERLRKALYAALDEEAALLRSGRSRAPSGVLGVVARIDGNRQALRELERTLVAVQSRLEQAVQSRVDSIRQQVLAELRTIQSQRGDHQQLALVADSLLEPLAEQTAATVGSQLESFVVEADVGILDVAWARKRERTGEVTEMVRELRRRGRELEEDFGEVLLNEDQ